VGGHIDPHVALKIHLDGYFAGIITEIEEETLQVEQWPQENQLASEIRRKRQELNWLKDEKLDR